MRMGMMSGQAEALRAAYAAQRRRLSRRGWLIAAVSSATVGACGFAAGRLTSPQVPSIGPATPMETLALGPLDELRRQAMHVETAFLARPDDPALATAIQRLFTLALTKHEDEALARRLLRLSKVAGVPTHVVEAANLLEAARRR